MKDYRPRCPVCKGPTNRMDFVRVEEDGRTMKAVYIVECWSGNISDYGPYHRYLAKITLVGVNELDPLRVAEERIEQLEVTLEEAEKKLEAIPA